MSHPVPKCSQQWLPSTGGGFAEIFSKHGKYHRLPPLVVLRPISYGNVGALSGSMINYWSFALLDYYSFSTYPLLPLKDGRDFSSSKSRI